MPLMLGNNPDDYTKADVTRDKWAKFDALNIHHVQD
jgi:hypothetical protein